MPILAMFVILLMLIALALFIVAAATAPANPWSSRLGLIGLACWVAAEILTKAVR